MTNTKNIIQRYDLNSVSLKYALISFVFIAMKCKIKFNAEISIKKTHINSIELLSKYPMLELCVENPPIAIVEKLCAIESNIDIPAR